MKTENICSSCGIPIPFSKRKCSHCVKEKAAEKRRADKTPHKLNSEGNYKIT